MARAMKDSGITWLGKVPEHWAITKIKYVLQERIENNNPIRTNDILSLTAKQGVIPYHEKEGGGNKPKEDVSAYRLAYPGDIVMNSMNILSGSVGLSRYFGCVSPVYYMLRPHDTGFDVRFFNYVFQTTVFQRSLYGLGNGILIKESGNGKLNTIRMRIPMDKFGRLYIPVASTMEQRIIADYLDIKCAEIDALMADVQAQIETLEQYKRSVITEAVTKGLNPNVPLKAVDSVWITEIPATWQFMKAGYLFVERSVRAKGNETPLSLSQKDGLVITDEMTEHAMKSKTYDGWKKVWVNDLVLNRFKAHLGVFFCSKYNGMVSFHYGVYVPLSKLNVKFYEYLFHSKPYCEMFADLSNGITVGLQNLGNANFYSAKCVYPSPAEQDRIVEYLDAKCAEIDAIIDGKRQQLATLEEYKKSIIFEYVTGKKEVPTNA